MTKDQRDELVGFICDAVEYFCGETQISEQEAWKTVEALSLIQLQLNKGNRL